MSFKYFVRSSRDFNFTYSLNEALYLNKSGVFLFWMCWARSILLPLHLFCPLLTLPSSLPLHLLISSSFVVFSTHRLNDLSLLPDFCLSLPHFPSDHHFCSSVKLWENKANYLEEGWKKWKGGLTVAAVVKNRTWQLSA